MKTLADLNIYDVAHISKISLEKEYKQRLQDLGLHVCAKIVVFNKTKYDSIIVVDDYTKLTIGNEIAKNIFVV